MNNSAIIQSVQARLGITPDGIAGINTWNAISSRLGIVPGPSVLIAIKAVQYLLHLAVDGIDGPATWAAIARAVGATPLNQAQAVDWKSLWNETHWAGDYVKLIGVRGWLAGTSKDNREDIYDDLIVRMIGNDVTWWRAAVDPTTYLIRHPINADGAAQLQTGLWLFKCGIHKGDPAHPCLVQAEDFTVNRLRSNGAVYKTDAGDFGIHMHSGGAPDDTGRFSAGCQIIQNPDGYWGKSWFTFYDPVHEAMKSASQPTVPYLLLNAEDLHA